MTERAVESTGAAAAPAPDAPPTTPPRVTLDVLKAAGRKGGASSGGDPFWLSRFFYRKFTIYFTWGFAKAGIGSKATTLISGIVLFAGAACYAMPGRWTWVAGALLVQLYFILDHVDGELARFERARLGVSSGMAGHFYDICCHAGELALMAAIGMRLFADSGGAWWVAVVTLLTLFPASVAPWQRYCEAVVAHSSRHVVDGSATVGAEFLFSETLAHAPPAATAASTRRSTGRHLLAGVLQFIGFPGYFVTLLAATLLDALRVPELVRGAPYLLLWMAVRALHGSAAAIKSMRVYGRRLEGLK